MQYEHSNEFAVRPNPARLKGLRDIELWYGSYYELGLLLTGHGASDQTALLLQAVLWHDHLLLGVQTERERLGAGWQDPQALGTEAEPLFGCLLLGAETILGCQTALFHSQEGLWVIFSVPSGMLELAFPVEYPLLKETNPWMTDFDTLLAGIGSRAFAQVPYTLGLIGEDAVAGSHRVHIETGENILVPESAFARLGLTPRGASIESGLRWIATESPST